MSHSCVRLASLDEVESLEEDEGFQSFRKRYEASFQQRTLPDLGKDSSLSKVVENAYLSNGAIESDYYNWLADIYRAKAAAYIYDPQISIEVMNLRDSTKTLNDLLDSLIVVLSQELKLPQKLQVQVEVYLHQAQQAGEQLNKTLLDVYSQIVGAYGDLLLLKEKIASSEQQLKLWQNLRQSVLQAYRQGNGGSGVLELTEIEVALSDKQNEISTLGNELAGAKAALNALLNRDANADFAQLHLVKLPEQINEEELMARLDKYNPELSMRGHEIEAKAKEIELAELGKVPDFQFFAGVDENLQPKAGMMFNLPIVQERIHWQMEEFQAQKRAVETLLRNQESELKSNLVMAINLLAKSQKLLTFAKDKTVPLLMAAKSGQYLLYQNGKVPLKDITALERMLLDYKLSIVEQEVEQMKLWAEIGKLTGHDYLLLGVGQ